MTNGIRLARSRAMQLAVAVLFSIGLVACGGDGEGGLSAPTAPISLDEENGAAVAAAALSASPGGFASSSTEFMGVDAQVDSSPTTHSVARIAARNLRRAAEGMKAEQCVTGASVTFTEACYYSGSVTLSGSETSFTLTFKNCSDEPGETLHGYIRASNYVETGDEVAGSMSATVALDLRVTDSGGTVRVVANFTMTNSWTSTTSTIQMTGSTLGYTDGVNTEILSNFDISETKDDSTSTITWSSDFTFASTVLGGSVTVDTTTPFEASLYGAHPYAGQLVITGANDTKLRLTVDPDPPEVLLELDADGDGTFELQLDLTWAELES
jgi:hypothetical protein